MCSPWLTKWKLIFYLSTNAISNVTSFMFTLGVFSFSFFLDFGYQTENVQVQNTSFLQSCPQINVLAAVYFI